MSNIEQAIQRRLQTLEAAQKKQILIALKTQHIEDLDDIARTLSGQSGRTHSRNMLIEDAVEAYIKDALRIFQENGIAIEPREPARAAYDTVIFFGYEEGFREAFLNALMWYYARMDKRRIPFLENVAIFVGAPVSQITHYGKIAPNGIEYVEEQRKYIIRLAEPAIALDNPIPLGDLPVAAIRSPRYTTLEKLLTATQLSDLL